MPSRRPSTPAEAPLEVANAEKPSPARIRAEPASQALAITKNPDSWCNERKRLAFSSWVEVMPGLLYDSGGVLMACYTSMARNESLNIKDMLVTPAQARTIKSATLSNRRPAKEAVRNSCRQTISSFPCMRGPRGNRLKYLGSRLRAGLSGEKSKVCPTANLPPTASFLSLSPRRPDGGTHACRDGEHRRVLATGLRHPRRPIRRDRRQCTADQERTGAQDRCEGRRVDRRTGVLWPDPAELCAGAAAVRPAALSLVEARSNCRNRVLKVLERANIKLASVASDVFGCPVR